jgi:hypothetical protein
MKAGRRRASGQGRTEPQQIAVPIDMRALSQPYGLSWGSKN